MKSLLLTNEYPPNVYGGAGVHVEFLGQELAKLIDVEVRSFGVQDLSDPNLRVQGIASPTLPASVSPQLKPVFDAFGRNLQAAAEPSGADVVHCHTWYVHLGGLMVKYAYGMPLVVTVHSLEPLRPWKREQLGGGYDLSSWVERRALTEADAVIAVSEGTKDDVLRLFDIDPNRIHVIHNGIDADLYRPTDATQALDRYGIDPLRRFVLFVGRITRQKGIVHLVRAIPEIDPSVQVVLCAGAPDTPEIAAEMEAAVAEVSARREGVIWIREAVPRDQIVQLYSAAAVFCCPSIYEPFGIINLEAMACGTPVVASKVGGIPEAVADGETGILVPIEQQTESPFEPVDPAKFSHDLAVALNRLLGDDALRTEMGNAGRRRVEDKFTWGAIAQRTVDLYQTLLR